MSRDDFPRPLTPVHGPFAPAKIAGAADGMGTYTRTRASGGAEEKLTGVCGVFE